jgi:MYXO-CTERM domain-containing protein
VAARTIANATLVGNGRGVRAAGAVAIKNSLLTGNGIALAADAPDALVSAYNDIFENQVGYLGASAGTGDVSMAVAFANLGQRDLRLLRTQPSTDRGDPADSSAAEPSPNGERVNLGAFGGTADAELSLEPSTAVSGRGDLPVVVGERPVPEPPVTASPRRDSGCAVGGRSDVHWPALLAAVGLLLARRRRR